MLRVIVITSYAFSVVSFALFVYQILKQHGRQPSQPAMPQATIADLAQLIEALSKLTDSFTKAGPAVMSLVATIFFLLIALMGSGFETALASTP